MELIEMVGPHIFLGAAVLWMVHQLWYLAAEQIVGALLFLCILYIVGRWVVIGYVSERSWKDAVAEEKAMGDLKERKKESRLKIKKKQLGDDGLLFMGKAPESSWITLHHQLIHYPGYLCLIIGMSVFALPRAFIQWVFRYTTRRTNPEVPDSFVFKALTESPCLLSAALSEDGSQLEFRAPMGLVPVNDNNISLSGLYLLFDVETQTLLKASRPVMKEVPIKIEGKRHRQFVPKTGPNGVALEENLLGRNRELVYMLVSITMCLYHFKTHEQAEFSAREILLKEVKQLEPSSRFVNVLHDGLLYSPLSPLRGIPFLNVAAGSDGEIFAMAHIDIKHNLDPRKCQFRYFNFLLQSHHIVAKLVAKHKLPVSPGPLFNNVVNHSIDHEVFGNLCEESCNKYGLSIDASMTPQSFVGGLNFSFLWMKFFSGFELLADHKLSSLAENKEQFPFYADLYKELSFVDQEYTDYIAASCSW